jgi:hypothetical protein
VTTEIMLVVALSAVVVLVMIAFAQHDRIQFYRGLWSQAEESIKEMIAAWKIETARADDLQNQLKLAAQEVYRAEGEVQRLHRLLLNLGVSTEERTYAATKSAQPDRSISDLRNELYRALDGGK